MQAAAARPDVVAAEPPAQLPAPPIVLAPVLAALSGAGCAQPPCLQAPAGEGNDGQQQPCSPAAPQGGDDVSRRTAAAEPHVATTQPPAGTAPCTPETVCEATGTAGERRHRAEGQAGRVPGATATAAAAPAAAGTSGAATAHHTLLRLQSFVHCVAGSPIVQSALMYLEHQGEHPTALPASQAAAGPSGRAAGAGLEWTMAQLLALWLRAGYTHARESALLSALWVLEAAHSAWRSPASVCLSSYTKLVGAFSPEVVRRLAADWPASFASLKRALAEAQMDLLQRTGWRMRLDLAADVLPCYIQLFCPALLGDPKLQLGQQAQLTMPAASTAAHQEWAAALRQLCAVIREKSRRLKAHEQASNTSRLPTPEPEDEAEPPAKRRRAAGNT